MIIQDYVLINEVISFLWYVAKDIIVLVLEDLKYMRNLLNEGWHRLIINCSFICFDSLVP